MELPTSKERRRPSGPSYGAKVKARLLEYRNILRKGKRDSNAGKVSPVEIYRQIEALRKIILKLGSEIFQTATLSSETIIKREDLFNWSSDLLSVAKWPLEKLTNKAQEARDIYMNEARGIGRCRERALGAIADASTSLRPESSA